MFKKIYKEIKKHDTIVIARHIGVDPDALASQLALKESIKLTFPNKKVYAIGNGSTKFSYMGKLDKLEDYENFLLIVLDTPDKKRIDFHDFYKAKNIIKIDHHPFIESFGGLEYINDKASSTCEILMELIFKTKLKCNEKIAKLLYYGLVSDSNRFLFDSSTSKTFSLVSKLLEKYPLKLSNIYTNLYLRPLKEVRLEGYISLNMQITENGVGHIVLTNDIINKFKVDSASAGNMINNFNFIDEVLVWIIVTEDIKNNNVRVNIRSRGPEINKIAEKYNGGGHALASGARLSSIEEAESLIADIDYATEIYIKKVLSKDENN